MSQNQEILKMLRCMVSVVAVLLVSIPTWADEKKFDVKALKGTWTREVNNVKLSFEFKDEKTCRVTLVPDGADGGPVIDCDFKADKDGTLNFTISDVDKKGLENLPNKGDKFSFKVEAGKEKLTVSEFKGVNGDDAKQLVEGEYTKKK